MATVAPDGSPVCVPVVYTLDDPDHLLLSIVTSASRGDRLSHLKSNPRMSIVVLDRSDWLVSVSIQGTALEFFEDLDLAIIDEMTMRYFGSPYADRRPRTGVRVRIDSWKAQKSSPTTANAISRELTGNPGG
jgi:hypothetical protein